MATEFFPYMIIQRTWVWETSKNRHFCIYFVGKSCWQSVEDQNGGRDFPIHAYTAYVSVRNVQKSPFLYILSMGKSSTIGQGPKWRSSFSRTCLYSVPERGKRPKITISVHTFYEKIVGNRSKTKMAIEFFSYMPIQRTWVWVASKNCNICTHFLWESCWQSVEDQNGGRVFLCTCLYSVRECG